MACNGGRIPPGWYPCAVRSRPPAAQTAGAPPHEPATRHRRPVTLSPDIRREAKQAFGGNGPVLVVFGCNSEAAGGRAGIRKLLRTIFERIMVVKTGASAPSGAMFDGTYAMLLLSQ